MDTINEKSTYRVTVTWIDEAGAPSTPTSASYRIDDVTDPANPIQVKTDTPITPGGPSHDIDVDYSDNRILQAANQYENRLITITWQYGGTKQGTAEYRYRIKNLIKVV